MSKNEKKSLEELDLQSKAQQVYKQIEDAYKDLIKYDEQNKTNYSNQLYNDVSGLHQALQNNDYRNIDPIIKVVNKMNSIKKDMTKKGFFARLFRIFVKEKPNPQKDFIVDRLEKVSIEASKHIATAGVSKKNFDEREQKLKDRERDGNILTNELEVFEKNPYDQTKFKRGDVTEKSEELYNKVNEVYDMLTEYDKEFKTEFTKDIDDILKKANYQSSESMTKLAVPLSKLFDKIEAHEQAAGSDLQENLLDDLYYLKEDVSKHMATLLVKENTKQAPSQTLDEKIDDNRKRGDLAKANQDLNKKAKKAKKPKGKHSKRVIEKEQKPQSKGAGKA